MTAPDDRPLASGQEADVYAQAMTDGRLDVTEGAHLPAAAVLLREMAG